LKSNSAVVPGRQAGGHIGEIFQHIGLHGGHRHKFFQLSAGFSRVLLFAPFQENSFLADKKYETV